MHRFRWQREAGIPLGIAFWLGVAWWTTGDHMQDGIRARIESSYASGQHYARQHHRLLDFRDENGRTYYRHADDVSEEWFAKSRASEAWLGKIALTHTALAWLTVAAIGWGGLVITINLRDRRAPRR